MDLGISALLVVLAYVFGAATGVWWYWRQRGE